MERSALRIGERYLMRIKGKQVPVVYHGLVSRDNPQGLALKSPFPTHRDRRLDRQADSGRTLQALRLLHTHLPSRSMRMLNTTEMRTR